MSKVLLWLAEDLRVENNLALSMALSSTYNGCAAVRILPECRGRPLRTQHRQKLGDAAEIHLRQKLEEKGVAFEVLGRGDDFSIARLCRKYNCTIVLRNAWDGMPAEIEHRQQCETELRAIGIGLVVVNGEMIKRDGVGGQKPLEPYLSASHLVEEHLMPQDHPITLLRRYLGTLPERDYRAAMWIPGRDRLCTSLLSTHFAAGTLSSYRAAYETDKAAQAWSVEHLRAKEISSFRWFKRSVICRPGFLTVFSRHLHLDKPGLVTPDQQLAIEAWRNGDTGMPLPDAAMRELKATGWINFRLRQLSASYGVQLLRLPAHEVGLALAEMFDDYEPGITWPQVALNEGTLMHNLGPRILNPVKQGYELDPSESYIRAWLPELRSVPPGFAHEPWRLPNSPVRPPLIDHNVALRNARANWDLSETVSQPSLF